MSERRPTTRFDLPEPMRRFFRDRAAAGADLAWVVVAGTAGSTYSKAGAQMLIDGEGESTGMLSGGCLEGDLSERALAAIASGRAASVTYDLENDDALFGLGIGCDGTLDVLVKPLTEATGYAPLALLLDELDRSGRALFRFERAGQGATDVTLADDRAHADAEMRAPWRLLVLGAGEDAQPLLQFAATLGWRVRVVDHRPAVLERIDRAPLDDMRCMPVAEFSAKAAYADCDAAIVMSHNLDNDRAYLAGLAMVDVDFIGLLGPPHRRDRLLAALGDRAPRLRGRLRAPVGRRIGGRGPAAIALEIVAELQDYFARLD